MTERTRRDTTGWGLTALRVTTGALMAGHGVQKLSTKLGGGGPEITGIGFDMMGLRPGKQHAYVAGVTEIAAGALSILGLFTPLASAMNTGTMTVAMAKVHGKNGPWITKGGYEYNATLVAVAFTLATAGPGKFALDGTLVKRRAGLGWAVAQLAVGAGAAFGVMEVAKRQPVPARKPRSKPKPEAAPTADENGSKAPVEAAAPAS